MAVVTTSARRPSDDAGEDAEAAFDGFDAGDAVDGGELFFEQAAVADAAHAEVVDVVAADGGFEGGGGVFDEDLAVVDDGEAVAERVGLFHVVGGEDDGDAFAAEGLDGVPHGDAALRIEAGAGLVEEEDLGAMGDGAGDLQALREAAAERLRIGGGAVAEAKLLEQLRGAAGRLLAWSCRSSGSGSGCFRRRCRSGRGCCTAARRRWTQRARAGWATTSMPAMWTEPAVGMARVVAMEMVVVLPAPLGPSRP